MQHQAKLTFLKAWEPEDRKSSSGRYLRQRMEHNAGYHTYLGTYSTSSRIQIWILVEVVVSCYFHAQRFMFMVSGLPGIALKPNCCVKWLQN